MKRQAQPVKIAPAALQHCLLVVARLFDLGLFGDGRLTTWGSHSLGLFDARLFFAAD